MRALSYQGVHALIRRLHGPARDHLCADCGRPGQEWSYDRRDPDEQQGVNGGARVSYSTDPDHYQARCIPCHRRLDHARNRQEAVA